MSLNFFISSQFDSSGHRAAMSALEQAGIKTEELSNVMARLRQENPDILSKAFTTESIQQTYAASAAATELSHALNQAAAAALNAGNSQLSKELANMAREAKRASTETRELVNNEAALVKGSKNLQISAKEMGKSLDDLNKRYQELSNAALAYASTPGMNQQLADTRTQLANVQKEIGHYSQSLVQLSSAEDLLGEKGDINHKKIIRNLTQEIKLIEEKILKLRLEAVQLDDLGDKSGAAVRAAKADQLEGTVRMFRKTRQSVADAHKGFLSLEGYINSDFLKAFNRLGFALFITRSSFGTIIKIIGGMYKAMKSVTTQMDKFQGAATVFAMHGFDANEVRAKFMTAAGGAVTMQQAMDGAMQFMKAGQPQLAAQADELLAIARASAKLSGDLSKTAEIYDKLIRGVVRGSPKLIDDTGIVLKLGEANQKYAASIGKTVEELTAADKIMATYLATVEGGKVIRQMADATESASEKFMKLEGAITNRWMTMVVTGMNAIASAMDGTGQGIDKFVENMDHGTQIMAEWNSLTFDYSKNVQQEANSVIASLVGINESLSQGELNQAAMAGGVIHAANQLRMERGEVVMLTADMRSWSIAHHEVAAARWAEREAAAEQRGELEELSQARRLELQYLDMEKAKYDAVTEAVQANIDKIKQRIGIADNVDLRGKDAADNFETILENIQKAWTESDRNEEILELETDLQSKLLEIDEKYAEERKQVQEEYKKDIADLAEETRKAIEEEREDFNKSITRMQEDLDRKLDDIHDKALEKNEDTEKKHNKKMEDIEEGHQRKLDDIQRKYETARLKAIIDRDARALFEAEAQRAEALAKAKEDAEDKKAVELEKVKEKRAEIEAEERKQTQNAIDEFDVRKARMQEDYDDQINQMRENFRQQKAERNAQRKEKLDEMREAWKEQKAKEQEQHDERLKDMRAAWEKERIESQRANFVREQERLLSLLREGQMTEEWMDQYIQTWKDFGDALKGMTITPPIVRGDPRNIFGGGDTDSRGGRGEDSATPVSSGISGSSSPSPAAIIPGASCSGVGSRGYVGFDGNTYVCVGGRWVPASSLPQATSSPQSTTQAGNYGNRTIGGGNVTLNVQGDELVKGIIKDTTYEVIVDLYD